MIDINELYSPPLDGPGSFIVIEGIDGAGKTIQAQRLIDRMLIDGRIGGVNDIRSMRQPTRGQYGQKIREFAQYSKERKPLIEFTLFLADRLEQAEEVRKIIRRGETIVMDRCYHTSVAYQSVTGDLDPSDIHASNLIVFPKPDLYILIDIPADVAMERIQTRPGYREVFEDIDFLTSARSHYKELVKKENGVIIDGIGTIDEVEERIWNVFANFITNHPRREGNEPWYLG